MRKPSRYKKFNIVCVGFLTITLGIILFFNLTIDALGIYRIPTFYGINLSKPEKYTHQRLYKSAEVIQLRPTVIFLGSSRTQYGLDPEDYFTLTGNQAYNLGLTSATMYEQLR